MTGRVVVALSGGVDSSVAAALLKEQGYTVIGMMMRLWSEPGTEAENRCCTPDAMALARRVAAKLGIPFYAVDAQETFHSVVVQSFVEAHRLGVTPNPCVACNRTVRWEFLLNRALAIGADFMATGHYARVRREGDTFALLQGVDAAKDQSYVLHVLGQEQLAHALFPLGELTKPEVRRLAQEFGLPVADRAESQDLCFLGRGDYREFLDRNAPGIGAPGPILTRDGRALGQHAGLHAYTIGQRKGLGLSSPVPLFVLEKDRERNALVVGLQEELGRQELATADFHWVSGQAPAAPFRAEVKIRYKAPKAWAEVTPLASGGVLVRFDAPLRDITPGQAAVVYDGERVLGGGLIQP